MFNLEAVDDNELMRTAQAGETRAFDALVERHTPMLYRVVRRMSSDRMEAEAIVQESWMRAWNALHRYQSDRPLKPWLTRIAVNVARDRWRLRRPVDFADLGAGALEGMRSPVPGPEISLERKQAAERLAAHVDRLRPEYRMALALRYEAELSYQEIADLMEAPVNTVRTYLHRAKAELRARMEADEDGSDG